MLEKTQALPTLPATDLRRAKVFYTDKLGLNVIREEEMVLVLSTGSGSPITIYERPEPTKAEHTAVTFEVTGLENEIRELEQKGIRFEDYDFPGLKTNNHIAARENDLAAWFKDSEGNIICLHEELQ